MQAVAEAIKNVTGLGEAEQPREPEDWLRADSVEDVKPDEDEKAGKIGELIRRMMDHNFDAHQHKFRATHVKSQGFVKGTLTISPNLPPHLQHGLFSHSSTNYPCIARYANEPSFLLPDNQRAPRGLGLKVFNVNTNGPRLSEDGLDTQDFLFNNAPIVELTDIDTTLEIFELREKYFDSPATLQLELAKRSDRLKQFAPGLLPNTELIGDTMFSQSAFAYGPYVAHFSLRPSSEAQEPFMGKTIPSSADGTYHRTSLQSYYASHSSTYTLRAQFASNLSKHPVEDASVEWDEKTAPWHDLATLTFPSQETFSDARRVWWEDHIALTPWSGLRDHKPLGSINRLRNKVYKMGRGHRGKGNNREIVFPKSSDEMPE